MALVMLVRTTDNSRTRVKNRWDVVAIGLSVTRWGRRERREFQRVEIDADDIQQLPLRMRQRLIQARTELQAKLVAGDPNPFIVTPFTTFKRDKTRQGAARYRGLQSEFAFNLDQLPAPRVARIKNPNIVEPTIDYADVKTFHIERQDKNKDD